MRKSSPSGHLAGDAGAGGPYSRGRDIGGKDSIGSKVGLSQMAGGNDYRMADYGIQKVVPGSREGLGGSSMPYSSAPQYNDGV